MLLVTYAFPKVFKNRKLDFFKMSFVLGLVTVIMTQSRTNWFSLGVVLFVLGAFFTLLVLSIMKHVTLEKQNIFNVLFYLIIYLASYPFIMIFAISDLILKKTRW